MSDENQTIIGGSGDDLLVGGSGDDLIIGNGGNDTIDGGAGNDTLIGGGGSCDMDGNNIVSGGEGDDLILGGTGNDSLFGGAGNDTIIGGSGNNLIVGGSGNETADDYTVTITFEGGTAGFQNTLGIYIIDPVTGEITDVQFVFPNASPEGDDPLTGGGDLIPGETSFSVTVPPGSTIGTFIVSNGFQANNGYEDLDLENGTLEFVNEDGSPADLNSDSPNLVHVAPDGTVTPINGPVFHSAGFGDNINLNPDDFVYIQGFSENEDGTWTFGFEDLPGGGDQDFDDVLFTVDLGNSGSTFLNPDYDASSTTVPQDPDTANTLIGGDGDDFIVTGAGQDTVDAGAGDDTISAGPGDFVDGGEGFDALIIRDWENVVAKDITKEIDPETGIATFSGTITYANPDGSPPGEPGDPSVPDGDPLTLQFVNINAIIPCFTPGTSIATPEGERLIETLREGDRILTRDNGIQEIRWIGKRVLDWKGLQANPHLRPILIEKGALGNGLPERDMLVSPQHRVLVANERTALYFEEHEVLVAAKHLLDHKGIREVESLGVTYVHFMCDRHEVVLSNSAWTETFQPGDYTLKGMGNSQRLELFELFPDLKTDRGREAYGAARKTLKRHEARLLAS